MRYVNNKDITDPRINLALEEHLLRNLDTDEPILLFYINEPSVIIGRNQNTIEEIDPAYVDAQGIHVIRRISGGGAVYHDHGNLNFSFITQGREDLHNFARFTGPVIRVLGELGLEVELRGKSDIFAGDKKISGNAQYATATRMFSHGTLLFDSDIEAMLKALNPKQVQISSKAVQSVRNFVTNIRELLPVEMDIMDLKQALLRGIFESRQIPEHILTAADWEQVRRISEERYKKWDWNYGHSPQFNIQKQDQFPAGSIDLRIDVEKGRIEGIRIFGSFAGKRPVEELEQKLSGVRYRRQELAEVLEDVEIGDYFGELDRGDLLELLY